jgi:hypothetical protein
MRKPDQIIQIIECALLFQEPIAPSSILPKDVMITSPPIHRQQNWWPPLFYLPKLPKQLEI